jgi:hypothetical protein
MPVQLWPSRLPQQQAVSANIFASWWYPPRRERDPDDSFISLFTIHNFDVLQSGSLQTLRFARDVTFPPQAERLSLFARGKQKEKIGQPGPSHTDRA